MRKGFVLFFAVWLLAPYTAWAAGAAARTAAAAASPLFRHYGPAEGLRGAMIYGVTQDRSGGIWFSTSSGLVGYDGVAFHSFQPDFKDAFGTYYPPIYSIYADPRGGLWLGGVTAEGLMYFDPATERYTRWKHDAHDPHSLANDEVWSIVRDTAGVLWVATTRGLDRMRTDGKGFDQELLDAKRHQGFGETRALLTEPDGALWIGSDLGIFRRDSDGRLQRIALGNDVPADISRIWRIEGGGADLRVATSAGLLRIGSDRVAHLAYPELANVRVMGSTRDQRGRLWIGTAIGLYLDDGGGHLRVFRGQPLLPGGLPDDWIWQVFCDREGGLWLTQASDGAAYLAPTWDRFSRFSHIPDDPTSLQTVTVETVVPSRDGRIWVGLHGGVDKLDPSTGQVQHILAGRPEAFVSIAEGADGRLWLVVEGATFVLDRGHLRRVGSPDLPPKRPARVLVDAQGRVFLGSYGEGIFQIDPTTLSARRVPMASHTLDAQVESVMAVHRGQVWYASGEGVMRWNEAGRRFDFVPGVAQRYVVTMSFDADGSDGFWVTWNLGRPPTHYVMRDGRATVDRQVSTLEDWERIELLGSRADREGRLWLFGPQGLWRMDPATSSRRAFGRQDGLASDQFTTDITTILSDGSIFAATRQGVIGFDPRRLHDGTVKRPMPTVAISDVRIDRGGRPFDLDAGGQPLSLGWHDRNLHVEARVSSYVNPEANRFRFRMRGLDNQWVDVGAHGSRDFAALPAGDYALEVMAAAPRGPWGQLASPMLIQVQAPPWARWWAWMIYVVVAGALMLAIERAWRRRVAQRHRMALSEQQRQLAEQASAAKSEFLATLSHELRTPMTGVMGMAELLMTTSLDQQQREYTQAMQQSGNLLLKLINDTLDLARIEAGRLELEPKPFDPRRLVADVIQLAQGLARARGLQLGGSCAENLPGWLIGDPLRITQILLNLVGNGLKFTHRGSVRLHALREEGGVCFRVSDTGPGIPHDSQARLFARFEQEDGPQRRSGTGLGLAICRELVDLMDGRIALESRPGLGSTFTVHLPLPVVAASMPSLIPVPVPEPGPANVGPDRAWHVLLVEDDATVGAVITGLLEHAGHRAWHVGDGLAALAEFSRLPFDAVLLDLDLPGVNGFQVARLIRQHELSSGAHTPIVAITARSGRDSEARARVAGMDGFLLKPVTSETLLAALLKARQAGTGTPARVRRGRAS